MKVLVGFLGRFHPTTLRSFKKLCTPNDYFECYDVTNQLFLNSAHEEERVSRGSGVFSSGPETGSYTVVLQ